MSDSLISTTPWSPPEELPEHPYRFVPVPRLRGRRDGWTSDRQHAFVWALARVPSIAKAAASVGMSVRSAYRLREAPGAAAFALAWDDALEIGMHHARDTAIERGLAGVVVPVVHRGRIVGERRRFNDRLLTAALVHVAMERDGRLVHQRAIGHRRELRAADIRYNGPPGQDDIARARYAEDAARAAESQTRLDRVNAANLGRGGAREPASSGPAIRSL